MDEAEAKLGQKDLSAAYAAARKEGLETRPWDITVSSDTAKEIVGVLNPVLVYEIAIGLRSGTVDPNKQPDRFERIRTALMSVIQHGSEGVVLASDRDISTVADHISKYEDAKGIPVEQRQADTVLLGLQEKVNAAREDFRKPKSVPTDLRPPLYIGRPRKGPRNGI